MRGPTLGAASTLAAQGTQLGPVGWIAAAENGRRVLGVLLVFAGAIIVAGYDKAVETWLVERSPAWLTELTTRL